MSFFKELVDDIIDACTKFDPHEYVNEKYNNDDIETPKSKNEATAYIHQISQKAESLYLVLAL